jgi:hypothetical protein
LSLGAKVSANFAKTLEWLPLNTRLECYRQFAQEAFRKANEATDPDCRAELFNMAAGWHSLADEIERSVRADPLMPNTSRPGPSN